MTEPYIANTAPVDRSGFMLSSLHVLQCADEITADGASATRVPPLSSPPYLGA